MTPRILLLDDDPDLRALARGALEPMGLALHEADRPEVALGEAELLLVGSVAAAAGLPLVERLREAGQSARVVLLGDATLDEGLYRRTARLNVRQILPLPFAAAELRLAVWAALHQDDVPPPHAERVDEQELLRLSIIRGLPARVASLGEALACALEGQSGSRERARYLAGKLADVAGTVGLEAVAEAARRMEQLLQQHERPSEAQREELRLLLNRARAGCRVTRGPAPVDAGGRLGVLLLDDQPGFLDGLQAIGPHRRIELVRAENLEEAARILGQRRVDLAIASRDLGEPELVAALRAQPGQEHLPVALYGRSCSFSMSLQGAAQGVLAELMAPPTVEDVLACVRRLEAGAAAPRVLQLSAREGPGPALERRGVELRREPHALRLPELLAGFAPQVVLLDALLSGPPPLTLVRALAARSDAPAVAVYNLPSDPELRAEALRAGAFDALGAELEEGELLERVIGRARRAMAEQRAVEPHSGLLDGALFRDLLDRRLSEARRRAETVSVGLVGLDHRHSLRALLGAAGLARVEASVTRRLVSGFRRHDLMGVAPHDTFAVLFLEERPSSARLALMRVLGLVRSLRFPGPEGRFSVSCSAGVVAFPVAGTTADELLDAAERLLDRAREEGGDRVVAG